MQRFALGCAILAFAIWGSPVTAQQAMPEQAAASTAQVPPQPQAEPLPAPPPFPPLHKASPSHRVVDLSKDYPTRSRHHAKNSSHHGTSSARHHAGSSKRHAKSARRATNSKHRAASSRHVTHFSNRTIRQCHAMSYRQIMKNSNCRTMMQQDLEKSGHHKPAHRKTSHRKSAKATHKATTHHRTAKRHKS